MAKKLISLAEAARRYNVSSSTMRRWLAGTGIAVQGVKGGIIRVDEEGLDKLMIERCYGCETPDPPQGRRGRKPGWMG
jgi:hypothetical protein